MTDLSGFDPNSAGNPNNNIFGLPFSEDDARLVILPIPWEVTVRTLHRLYLQRRTGGKKPVHVQDIEGSE
jgi:hypothetical protein